MFSLITLTVNFGLENQFTLYGHCKHCLLLMKIKIGLALTDKEWRGLCKEYTLTPWLMEPGGSMPHSQGLSNNSYPEPNNPIPRIDTYLFKVHSNIVLPSMPRYIHTFKKFSMG